MKSLKPAAVFSVMIMAVVGAVIGVIGIGGSLVSTEAEAVGPAVEIFISDGTFAEVKVGGDRNGLTVEADANSLSGGIVDAADFVVWRDTLD